MVMGVNSYGNLAPPRGPSSGSGRPHMRSPFGRVTMTGKAGTTQYLDVASLVTVVNPGITLLAQTVGGNAEVSLTLAPTDLALNPDQGASLWTTPVVVEPAKITELPSVGTALKVKFVADCTIYIVGV